MGSTAIRALSAGGRLARWGMAAGAGDATVARSARAIQEGAAAYLSREYATIAIIGLVLAVVITLVINVETGLLDVVGAASSDLAASVGVNV